MANMKQHRPVLIVIAGPNGSGKTTITSKVLHHEWMEDAVYVNPDIIAQEKFGDWNSQEAIMRSVEYCEQLREDCLAEKRSLIFETVLSVKDKIDYIIRAHEAGFFIRVFFVSTSMPSINAARIAKRVMEGGHDVPITKIISRYKKSIANGVVLSSFVDRMYVYDNSVDDVDAKLLFRLSNGQLIKRYVSDIPEWASPFIP
jgi:predicted ABC-type ATPase